MYKRTILLHCAVQNSYNNNPQSLAFNLYVYINIYTYNIFSGSFRKQIFIKFRLAYNSIKLNCLQLTCMENVTRSSK